MIKTLAQGPRKIDGMTTKEAATKCLLRSSKNWLQSWIQIKTFLLLEIVIVWMMKWTKGVKDSKMLMKEVTRTTRKVRDPHLAKQECNLRPSRGSERTL